MSKIESWGVPARLLFDSLGLEVCVLRKRCNLTQETLAEAAAVSTNTVGRLERGQENITVEYLLMIAMHLGILPSELFAGAENRCDYRGKSLADKQSDIIMSRLKRAPRSTLGRARKNDPSKSR